jgi:hypothetical protein
MRNLQTFNTKICCNYSFSKKIEKIVNLDKQIEREYFIKQTITNAEFEKLVDKHSYYVSLLDNYEKNLYYGYFKVKPSIN